jgi:hypothetical protein
VYGLPGLAEAIHGILLEIDYCDGFTPSLYCCFPYFPIFHLHAHCRLAAYQGLDHILSLHLLYGFGKHLLGLWSLLSCCNGLSLLGLAICLLYINHFGLLHVAA